MRIFLLTILYCSNLLAAEKFSVELKSGDIFVGESVQSLVELKTEYGNLKIDLSHIQEIDFTSKTSVLLRNQDHVKGKLLLNSFSLKCELGQLDIPLSKVQLIKYINPAYSDQSLQWSEVKDGLVLGVRVNKTSFQSGETLSVYAELKNISQKPLQLRFPSFNRKILHSADEKTGKMVNLVMPYIKKGVEILEDFENEASQKGPAILPGAKIVFDFDVELIQRDFEDVYEQVNLLEPVRKVDTIKEKLHFKQKLPFMFQKLGETSVKLLIQYGTDKNKVIQSSAIKLKVSK